MSAPVVGFIHDLTFGDLPGPVVEQAKRCVLDLLGIAMAGRTTGLSRIAGDHAAEFFAPGALRSRMLFDGRAASPPGAGLAGAMTIDSCDGHDGHARTKGHVGVTVLPALLALADALPGMTGREFLACVALGYEIGTRAGIALHESACDYHTSGAWNALAAAALAARVLRLDPRQTREALGIAEYHGPRSQMMRCIDHPTMVKDGSGWGCMAGLSAGFLARRGFTGAPAITVEQAETQDIWSDLAENWRITEQYFKPQPVCRWAHPAIDAALALKSKHGFDNGQIRAATVRTFHHATRLAHAQPATTEEAQYSLMFPVAIALKHGSVPFHALQGDALRDPEVLRLSQLIQVRENAQYTALFPAERYAEVSIELSDGRRLDSGPMQALGAPDLPLGEAAIRAKFRHVAHTACGEKTAREIEHEIDALEADGAGVGRLLDLILATHI